MPHRTARPGAATGLADPPPDIETMRATARLLLGPDDAPDALPPASELDTLTLALRGHLELLAPEVERKAGRLRRESIPRYCALACVGEARGKLRAEPGRGPHGPVAYARKLARVLDALCDHYETVSTGRETREGAALRRLSKHCSTCRTCMTVDEAGVNASVPCEEGDRLYDEYRKARRGTHGAPLNPATGLRRSGR